MPSRKYYKKCEECKQIFFAYGDYQSHKDRDQCYPTANVIIEEDGIDYPAATVIIKEEEDGAGETPAVDGAEGCGAPAAPGAA